MESTGPKSAKPVADPSVPNPKVLAQKRKQRRLLTWTGAIIVVLLAAGFGYDYLSGAPDRARKEMEAGLRKMSPGAYDEAIQSFDRAIKIWPDFAEAYLNRGVAEHVTGRTAPALADLEKAVELDPNQPRAYNERGQIYIEGADIQRAIQEFDRSIQVKPSLEAYYQRGQAYERLGQHQKAVADFDSAISEFREAPYVYRARATAKRNAGDTEGAVSDEEAAGKIETANPN
jgi:tetratricopeptide (TPR) repeat protein